MKLYLHDQGFKFINGNHANEIDFSYKKKSTRKKREEKHQNEKYYPLYTPVLRVYNSLTHFCRAPRPNPTVSSK